jgi:hypothetical protein
MNTNGKKTIADLVHETLNDSSVLCEFGRRSLAKHLQSRRVVWIPVSSPFSGTPCVGGRRGIDENGQALRAQEIYTLGYSFELHVFAEDDDMAEALALNMVAAAHERFGVKALAQSFAWQDTEEGMTTRQPKIILTMQFKVGVTGEIKMLTPIVGVTLTATLEIPTT